ncbi:putative porin [Sulfurimonas sp. C5]|uniref:putative porin n=1 Tax=Sulfurimonas sp. C5 TaxID=3036947 RepID=UPI002458CE84|nr:putative porin [Sulfurimonas sp. C5]MDH4944509.1 putative porin [Sulfurimonas sp. C5]
MNKIVLSALAALTLGVVAAEATPNPTLEPKNVAKVTGIEHDILERIHFSGDLRLRYESKETYYRDGTETTNKYTYHNRYRLRLIGAVDLTENLTFEAGMRSGYANPTSGNQTFSNDKALSDYMWQSMRFNILNLTYKNGDSTVKVGRHPYMIYRPIKSQLIWDNDLSFNGLSYNYENDSRIINVGANQPTYAERINSRDNVNLYFAQYVEKMKFDNSQLNLGAGIYYYDGLKGNTAMYYPEDDGKKMGNTFVTDLSGADVYENDFHIVEGFAELKFKDVFGKPFTVAAGVAYNAAASNKNFGYDLAFQIGKAKNVHDWQVKYSYTDIQEDAVLGDHSDSDNFGGGSAARGHAIRTKYKFGKNTYLAGTFFYNTLYGQRNGSTKPAADYERVQLDAIIKF